MLLILLSLIADTAASLPTDIDVVDAVSQIFSLLGGLKGGVGALSIAVAVVQAVMLLARTPLGKLTGAWQWSIVTLLSCVSTLLAAKLFGASWAAAFVAGPFVAAVQVFLHQGVSQWQSHFAAAKVATGSPTPPPSTPAS